MLSEEEKKTIELLKTYENKLVYEIEDKDKKAVKIVLNLIEKLQEENKVFKRALDNETADRSNDLLELQKKDKQIDLMAEELQKHMFVLSVGKTIIGKKGIKEYYEQKATNDG